MSAAELSAKIETLVDHLRENREQTLSLADVASVTEVLIGTMQRYFRSVDTQIYREFRALSDYIADARREIASLQPKDLETAQIPRAGLELDAIVQQTEEATNTIMESAEAIMGADPADVEAFQATVQDNIVKIFEACSFQDITGQRISKVVQTLTFIEERILQLKDLLGVTEADIATASDAQPPSDDDKALLRGPALQGEGIDQSEVDALLGTAHPQAEPAPKASSQPKRGANKQDEIDALFG